MLKVGDNVLHQKNGYAGKVIGYGHEIVNGVFMPTLKVRVSRTPGENQKGFIEEDVSSVWRRVEEN